jgi:hypothetical protein
MATANVINEISAELRNSSDGFIYERGGQRYLITINRSENCILIYSDRDYCWPKYSSIGTACLS